MIEPPSNVFGDIADLKSGKIMKFEAGPFYGALERLRDGFVARQLFLFEEKTCLGK